MKALLVIVKGGNMIERTIRQTALDDEEIIGLYWTRNETAIQKTDIKYGKFLFKIAYNILLHMKKQKLK